ncbi:MAG TPA: energy transducer TonB [Acidobacteriaceae bacterium]|nr:energy transducer TonB [Acidobacteriaceae bacterium]
MRFIMCWLILSFCAVATAYTQTVDHPLQVAGNVVPPVLVHDVVPKMPHVSFFHKPKSVGSTVCGVVDEQGLPQNFTVAKSAGDKFDKSALDAVRQYRFNPAAQGGKPVAVGLCFQVNFKFF